MAGHRYAQIDMMKGLAIIGVVVIHSGISDYLLSHGGVLWLGQAVPVFMVLLGMNLGMSLSRADMTAVTAVYSPRYRVSRWHRVVVPFAITFAISAVIALIGYFTQPGYHVNIGGFTLVGVLPAGGPGNYFFTVLLQFVVVGPALWLAYRKSPVAVLAGAFLVDIGFEYWASRAGIVAAHPYIQEAWILRFVLAMVLGMWLSDGWQLASRRNGILLAAAAMSVAYLVYTSSTGWALPRAVYDARTAYFASYFYSALLVMVGMAALPSAEKGGASRLLARVGRDSYHVFLVQILWFSSLAAPLAMAVAWAFSARTDTPVVMIVTCAANVAACVVGGSIFSKLLAARQGMQT
jgi:peptidoglycan/LPS O-acetylase OafA/YrhL